MIAPERGIRPHDAPGDGRAAEAAPAADPGCPFCPGHEAELPAIVTEIKSPHPPGWLARVVPNKYPVMQPAPAAAASAPPRHRIRPSYGLHEVVIESPRHDADLAFMGEAEIAAVAALYRHRFRALMARPKIGAVILFRNRGAAAGASLRHPHAQLVALAMRPPWLRAQAAWARHCGAATGGCVTCAEIDFEGTDGRRIVESTPSFVAFAPFAASRPCEIWLVPRHHQASFAEIEETVTAEFGVLLRNTLRRLAVARDNPSYNFVVDSFDAPRDAAVAHWRLRIAPNLATWGGFELGTELPINPSSPEADAALLRAATLDPRPRY